MRRFGRVSATLGLATVVGLLLACGGGTGRRPASRRPGAHRLAPAAPSGAAPAPVSAAPTAVQMRKLTLGVPVTPPNMVHLAPYVAQEQGFFRDVGLDVEFKNFEGGVQSLRGSIAGGLDVAGTSSDPIIAAAARKVGVKAIGTYAPKLSVVMTAQDDIHAPADLKGRKVGIQEVGGFNEVMSRGCCRPWG